jgi:hypothetical protein
MELVLVFLAIALGFILLDGLSATIGRDSRLTFRDEVRPWI